MSGSAVLVSSFTGVGQRQKSLGAPSPFFGLGSSPVSQGAPSVIFPLNSVGVVAVRTPILLQRGVGSDTGDLIGSVYNDTGLPLTLVAVDVSETGLGGPWNPATILTGDPAFSFPAIGAPGGTAIQIPIQFLATVGTVWVRTQVDY